MDLKIKSWQDYLRIYDYSLKNGDAFWAAVAQEKIQWDQSWQIVSSCDFRTGKVSWFQGGRLNLATNCLDRHVEAGRGDHPALIWVGNELHEERRFSFRELRDEVSRIAAAFVGLGLTKGDRVVIYLPNIPELAMLTLACARLGIVHCIIFGGFSAASIQSRINDCGAKLVVTANGAFRGSKWIDLKPNVDEALDLGCPSVERVVVLLRHGNRTCRKGPRDLAWTDFLRLAGPSFPAPSHASEDPLFILYTSGSTGKPKGVLHRMGGYLTYAAYSFDLVFQPRADDVYWCTADMGWITGHSYLLYGPLANGTTTLMFEGVPTYPDPGRFWQIVEQYRVSIFYTSPTAIRVLASAGNEHVHRFSRASLRTLGSVGEPISPEAWKWYNDHVGESRCPIVDTWWQTETGGILISGLAGISPMRPGSASFPLPGIEPQIVDATGQLIKGSERGTLLMARSWPGQMSGVFADEKRFKETYLVQYENRYFTGDRAHRDEDGFFWIGGRTDDVIKVSGHRLGTAEIEAACMTHSGVMEAGVVGVPHPITGEALEIFVVLKEGVVGSPVLEKELVNVVRKEVGPLATPQKMIWVPGLPKTRSGKIMRRILKKIALGQNEELGDLSTLVDPSMIEKISLAVNQSPA